MNPISIHILKTYQTKRAQFENEMTSAITSGLSKLNPFSRSKGGDDEDKGEQIQSDSVGGGGHASRKSKITKDRLRVSHALKSVLVSQNMLTEEEVVLDSQETSPSLKKLLDRSHVKVPPEIVDRSHPLAEYFISSSHNTYLLAHQLYGSSAAVAYETALKTGARCVEIDAWDNDDNPEEPKVTHGFTLASHVPFRKVCETMRNVHDEEAREVQGEGEYRPAPMMISLENHCGAEGQQRLVDIMKEVFGDRLLSKRVRDEGSREERGSGEHVTLEELGSKICVIVEYHFPEEENDEDSSESDDADDAEEEKRARENYKQAKKEAPKGIIPSLADLGVYAQSVKPRDKSWLRGELKDGPHDHLINVSESALKFIMPDQSPQVSKHNAQHLMRVYPKGTRISSKNLNPVPFWGVGSQICALNWQTFDASVQLNEALFAESDGYVLKPPALRSGGDGNLKQQKRKLRLHIAGATDVPVPKEREADSIMPYVTCTLLQSQNLDAAPPKRKTAGYKQHKLGLLHRGEQPPVTDPVWDEVLEWEYDHDQMSFLRILIKSDDKFAANPVLCVGAVRLMYVTDEWCFVRMLDLKARETHCTLLVRFEMMEFKGDL